MMGVMDYLWVGGWLSDSLILFCVRFYCLLFFIRRVEKGRVRSGSWWAMCRSVGRIRIG